MKKRSVTNTHQLLRALFPQTNMTEPPSPQEQARWAALRAEDAAQLQAIREIGALVVAILDGHDDHCGGTCRIDLKGGHDCCYICNTGEELAHVWRKLRKVHWQDRLPEELATAVLAAAEGEA